MLDKKTSNFLEKLATQDATGMSQYKKRDVKSTKKHPATGAGVGATLGLTAGHLSAPKGKWGAMARLLGAAGGAYAGKKVGDLGTKTRTQTTEGVVKKQQKTKEVGAKPEVPRLTDNNVLKLLKS